MERSQSKRLELQKILCARIEKGFYYSREFPGVPYLSAEFDLNHITVRRALNELVEQGILCRKENGRIDLVGSSRQFRVALLTHGYMNPADKWFQALQECARKYKCSFTYIPYNIQDDPIIYEALNGDFDLFITSIYEPDKLLLEKMNKKRDKLVCLYNDIVGCDFYRLDGLQRSAFMRLFRKFAENGYKKIDFLSSTLEKRNCKENEKYYRQACKEFGFKGNFYTFQEKFDILCYFQGREEAQKLLDAGSFAKTEVIFTSNVEIAWGLIRALHDNGIRVPEDIQVVSFGGAEFARFIEPEITTIGTPDRTLPVKEMFEHFMGINPQPGKKVFNVNPENYSDQELIFQGKTVKISLI